MQLFKNVCGHQCLVHMAVVLLSSVSTFGSSGITIFLCECYGVRWVSNQLWPPELWCVNVKSFAPQINVENFLRSRMFVRFLYVCYRSLICTFQDVQWPCRQHGTGLEILSAENVCVQTFHTMPVGCAAIYFLYCGISFAIQCSSWIGILLYIKHSCGGCDVTASDVTLQEYNAGT